MSTTVKKIDYNGLKMDFVASKNTNNLKPFLIYYNHFFMDTDNETQLYSVVFKELQCGKTKLCLVKKNQSKRGKSNHLKKNGKLAT